jgi:hypothetical protein
MSARSFRIGLALAVLASSVPLLAEEARSPRAELDAFAIALDRALGRVSRPAAPVLSPVSGDVVRGYHLKGYGVVFVVPARVLPPARTRAQQSEAARALDQAARRLEEVLKRVEDAELRRRVEASLKALRDTEAELRAGASPADTPPPGQDDLVDLDDMVLEPELAAQTEAMRRDAQRTHDEVDRALTQIELQVRPPAPGPRKAPADPEAPEAPQPPQPPAPPQAPPWSFWFEHDEVEARGPERVIRDVGDAVTQVLETHGARLGVLRPDDALIVAVDFVPRSGRLMVGFGPEARRLRAERTLVVRVRKRELEARRDGKLAPEELRKRIEYVEY